MPGRAAAGRAPCRAGTRSRAGRPPRPRPGGPRVVECLGVTAQVTVDGCEQPEGVCFAAVSRLAVQSYRLVEVVEGVVGPSEGMQGLGGVDEVVRLAATGSELACQRQRFSVVLESLYEPAHLPICSGKA